MRLPARTCLGGGPVAAPAAVRRETNPPRPRAGGRAFPVLLGLLLGSLSLDVAAGSPAASADLAARTVIVANASEAESVALARYYAAARGIPAANLVALPMPGDESITWRQFVDQVWQPLQDELIRRGWLDGLTGGELDWLGRKKAVFAGQRIAYLVTCRGVPLRIFHDPTLLPDEAAKRLAAQLRTNQGAVDSELSLLAAGNYDVNSLVANPLFDQAGPTTPAGDLIIKVARLDGPALADARSLVDSALAGEQDGLLGRWYVDRQGPNPEGDKWLEAARRELENLGFDGDVEDTYATFGPEARFDAPVLYFGWYARDVCGPFVRPGFRFAPGAIAEHIHSFSAESLRSASAGWCGPFVARGAAATVGNVFEPYLSFLHRPDLLLQSLAGGATLGDAAYFALPALSWQAVLIGDPLYRPFQVSLADQQKRLARLPPELAPYALIRAARLLAAQGRSAEAASVLEAGQRQFPGLVLALARARLAQAKEDGETVVAVLEPFQDAAFPPGEWALAREAAGLLGRHGAPKAALAIYTRLAHGPAPSPEAQRGLCIEARESAERAGDAAAASEFSDLADRAAAQPR